MKRKKILLILLIVFVVAAVAIGIWQRNNIKAIAEFSRYSNKEISNKIEENKNELKEEIEKTTPNLVRDFTPEEKKLIASGKVTIDEMVKKVIKESSNTSQNEKQNNSTAGSGSSKTGTETNKNGTTDSGSSKTDKEAKIDAVINEHVAKMYGLEAYYLGRLGNIESTAQSSVADGKKTSISQYISNATSLEGQCDAKINEVLSSLKTQLTNLGGDVSIVSSLRSAYEKEKSLKKAYFMSLLK